MPDNEVVLSFGTGKQLILNSQTCCIIGSNGTGKSSLAKELKNKNEDKSVEVIVAQKNLIVQQGRMKGDTDEELYNKISQFRVINSVKNETLDSRGRLGNVLNHNLNNIMQDDFNVIIELLNRDFLLNHAKASYTGSHRPDTKFEKIKDVWSRLFLKPLNYDFNNSKYTVGQSNYEIENLSDGEKSALYYLVKCSFAPENSIIVVDECETYLNPALLGDLWDNIEKLRRDCKFIYISHDIDFVVSRLNSKKYWIKSFNFPAEWEIDEIQDNVLPEELVIQIIGTKKEKILFVESINDAKLYNKIYSDFKIIPVNNCHNVIWFTKSLNQFGVNYGKQYFGLIDRDFRSENEINSLRENKIYCLSVAEYEEIFFKENIVRFLLSYLGVTDIDEKLQNLKNSILELRDSEQFRKDFYKCKTQNQLNQMLSDFSVDSLTFSVDKDVIDKEWEQIHSITDYDDFLTVINTKEIKGKTSAILLSWSQYYNQILNILNTEKENEFKSIFMSFMPIIE